MYERSAPATMAPQRAALTSLELASGVCAPRTHNIMWANRLEFGRGKRRKLQSSNTEKHEFKAPTRTVLDERSVAATSICQDRRRVPGASVYVDGRLRPRSLVDALLRRLCDVRADHVDDRRDRGESSGNPLARLTLKHRQHIPRGTGFALRPTSRN